jgi:hypothetical protein
MIYFLFLFMIYLLTFFIDVLSRRSVTVRAHIDQFMLNPVTYTYDRIDAMQPSRYVLRARANE